MSGPKRRPAWDQAANVGGDDAIPAKKIEKKQRLHGTLHLGRKAVPHERAR